MHVFLASRHRPPVPDCRQVNDFRCRRGVPRGSRGRTDLETGGGFMKRIVLVAAVLAMTGSAFAADMPLKAVKAPAPAPFDPWDIAFGAAAMNDYLFRGVTQSNHNPSVAAYFEPRYNVTKDLQLYIGTSGES